MGTGNHHRLRARVLKNGWLVQWVLVGQDAGGNQEPAIWFDAGAELIVEKPARNAPLLAVFRTPAGDVEYLALNLWAEPPTEGKLVNG